VELTTILKPLAHFRGFVEEHARNNAKLTLRNPTVCEPFDFSRLALYHSPGKLPEPESTHNFF